MIRWSLVRNIKINSITQSSILQIGDNETIKPEAKVLAVQREVAQFNGDEGDLDSYPVFSRELPKVSVTEPITMSITNECNNIHVGFITILGVSTSGVIQVGKNEKIEAESRVKHIRQFVSDKLQG